MFLLWSGLALAAPCPNVDGLIDQAWSAFDEAEVELARKRIAQAHDALSCQQDVVEREQLLELYHLDALASVAAEDERAALYAIIRGVTLDPEAMPPEDVGPELFAQHQQWAARLRSDRVEIRSTDDLVSVWVDGQEVVGEPLPVVVGEHLVQVREDGAWTSRVLELSEGGGVHGLPIEVQAVKKPSGAPPAPPKRNKGVRPGLVAGGVSLIVVGGGLVGVGSVLEKGWKDDPYLDSYGGCAPEDACWSSARARQIGADARRANAFYLSGYTVAGVGVGLLGVQVGLSVSDQGGMLRLGGRW